MFLSWLYSLIFFFWPFHTREFYLCIPVILLFYSLPKKRIRDLFKNKHQKYILKSITRFMGVLTLFLSGFWHDHKKRLLSWEFSPSCTTWQKPQEEWRDVRVSVTSSCRGRERFYTASRHQSCWRLPSSAQGCWNLTALGPCSHLLSVLGSLACWKESPAPLCVADASTSNFLNSAVASCSCLFFSVPRTDACADSAAHGGFWVIK